MRMARNHGLMGPDTDSAALKIALSCRSRVVARAFRAEGPGNGLQGTGMTAENPLECHFAPYRNRPESEAAAGLWWNLPSVLS